VRKAANDDAGSSAQTMKPPKAKEKKSARPAGAKG
jgi:hypothetical protein